MSLMSWPRGIHPSFLPLGHLHLQPHPLQQRQGDLILFLRSKLPDGESNVLLSFTLGASGGDFPFRDTCNLRCRRRQCQVRQRCWRQKGARPPDRSLIALMTSSYGGVSAAVAAAAATTKNVPLRARGNPFEKSLPNFPGVTVLVALWRSGANRLRESWGWSPPSRPLVPSCTSAQSTSEVTRKRCCRRHFPFFPLS